jgi:hypothetical protein
VAPVYDRPILGSSAASNAIIDINAVDSEKKIDMKAVDTEEKVDTPALLGPRPSYPLTSSKVAPSVKEPEPTRYRYAQSPPTAVANRTLASTAATAIAVKKSKFGMKGLFGKKK